MTISSSKTYLLPKLQNLPKEARIALAFENLIEGSFTSIRRLCDYRCIATFCKTKVEITYNNEIVMLGIRNYNNELWCVNLISKLSHTFANTSLLRANYIIPKYNVEKLTRFLHTACSSLSIDIFMNTIKKGYLNTWPKLLLPNVRQYLHAPIATILRHLDYQRKNKLSTKSAPV